jgi:hypothetical protein
MGSNPDAGLDASLRLSSSLFHFEKKKVAYEIILLAVWRASQ